MTAGVIADPAGGPPLGPESAAVVDETIARAAFAGERALSLARAAFCVAIVLRLGLFQRVPVATPHERISAPFMVVAILLSLYMIVRGWRHHRRTWILTASSVVDAAVCFAALAPSALWPPAGYGGIVRTPDTAALLIITAAAGLRISPAAAGTAALLNGVSLASLVAIDTAHGHAVFPDHAGRLSIWAIYLAAAGALALLVAHWTRRAVTEGARKAVLAEQTRTRLGELLQDHHDLRTILTSATLNADLAARAVEGEPGHGEVRAPIERLRGDLARADGLVRAVRSEAVEEGRVLRQRVAVVPHEAAAAVLGQVQPRFPGVAVTFHDRADGARVTTGGGQATLERILLNLVLNACEGDGVRSPRRVDVVVEPGERPDWLRFSVSDDGPGFPRALLPLAGQRSATTKKDGAGIGLVLVAGLLRANGSRLECENPPAGGARAWFQLPRVSPPAPA
jgi:signal transduction histidine kinase